MSSENSVQDSIRDLVRNSHPGNKLPIQSELAKRFGVSSWMVSRAMTRLSAEGLIQRRRKMGTIVTGRTSARTVTRNLGVIFSTAEVWYGFLQGFHSECAGLDREIVLFAPGEEGCSAEAFLSQIKWEKIDALAAFSFFRPETWSLLRNAARPVLACDMDASAFGVPSLTVDHEGGAELALKHLLSLGHRRIAQVGDMLPDRPTSDPALVERARAFERACRRLEVPLAPRENIHVSRKRRTSAEDLRPLFFDDLGARRRNAPTAIFYGGGGYVETLIDALEELGFYVPQDISVVAFGGGKVQTRLGAKVTEVATSMNDMGRQAARIMDLLADGRLVREVPKTPVRLVLGETTRPRRQS